MTEILRKGLEKKCGKKTVLTPPGQCGKLRIFFSFFNPSLGQLMVGGGGGAAVR